METNEKCCEDNGSERVKNINIDHPDEKDVELRDHGKINEVLTKVIIEVQVVERVQEQIAGPHRGCFKEASDRVRSCGCTASSTESGDEF